MVIGGALGLVIIANMFDDGSLVVILMRPHSDGKKGTINASLDLNLH